MEKPAAITYPIETLLQQRWSPRAFAERAVAPDTLRRLWEAAQGVTKSQAHKTPSSALRMIP